MSKLYTTEKNYRAYKALIASKFSGKSVSVQNVDDAKVATPEYVSKFLGKVPALEVGGSSLFDASAIAYYLSNAQLRGENELAQAQVLGWVSFADNELWPAVFSWVLPATGLSNQKQTLNEAKKEALHSLQLLNDVLLTRTYLVGERITLADIAVAVAVLPLYQNVLEPSVRKPFVNVTRWFTTLVNQKQFADVLGKVELCSSVKQLSAAKQQQAPKAEPKKEKKVEAKQAEADLAGDEEMSLAPKPKDPFVQFPAGKFDMDDFKRFYSNNPEDKSIPYFWEKLDKDCYSIWYCEYKYPEELTQVFMSCNLISGMFQRLDRMHKHAFGSMILFGEDNNSSISGVWVWRGPKLAFELSEDLQVDYESYEWTKLDPNDEKTKKLVKEYFSWEGDFGGKKFNQGKIFK